jgi:hypothetical protein
MRRVDLCAVLCAFFWFGCDAERVESVCPADQESFRGACVDPNARYEPTEQVDADNVVAYGEPFTELELPPPPKSGFRIAAERIVLEPGEEITGCAAWPIPDVKNEIVYASRIYTTPGLHHSNVIAKPIHVELGESPYPACRPGAGDAFENIGAGIPDVLFANSTQVVGEEHITFPAGAGYRLDTSREIVTSIHWLNPTSEPMIVEVAYDFFTMPESELTMEVAPFVMSINDFAIAPKSSAVVETTCEVFGGEVFTLMPHTHDLIRRFTVELVGQDGATTTVMDQAGYDLESDIESYEPTLDLEDVATIRYSCEFENPYDEPVTYGIGKNEMCILFGYLHPPEKQFAAYVDEAGAECTSLQIGLLDP